LIQGCPGVRGMVGAVVKLKKSFLDHIYIYIYMREGRREREKERMREGIINIYNVMKIRERERERGGSIYVIFSNCRIIAVFDLTIFLLCFLYLWSEFYNYLWLW
jgi:hypothetical protein